MKSLFRATCIGLWFIFLTFPILGVRVNTLDSIIEWRLMNMVYMGLAAFAISLLWEYLGKRAAAAPAAPAPAAGQRSHGLLERQDVRLAGSGLLAVLALAMPFISSTYQVNILTSALIYVILGLGLNIVVGLGGLLVLGYAAFFAVGAYAYGLLHQHFGVGFWPALPLGALFAAFFGLLLGFPVLRLRGDYLAIVTLGFGEIVRLLLENWNDLSNGPSGISGIPRPDFPGLTLDVSQSAVAIYYLVLVLVVLTIVMVSRLKESRIGRALQALREDEIACQAMGIDRTRTKLMAFGLGAMWAGMAGVVFAAKTTFINPACFTFMESAIILAVVVLGGMGSIVGVVLAALVLILLPEYLRAFAQYRMLIFGATMVLMMIFRPQGLVSDTRREYLVKDEAA